MKKITKKVSIDIIRAETGYIKHLEVMHDDAATSAFLVNCRRCLVHESS
jgi:hypothetical protein